MRISDWSSDVCSSDLTRLLYGRALFGTGARPAHIAVGEQRAANPVRACFTPDFARDHPGLPDTRHRADARGCGFTTAAPPVRSVAARRDRKSTRLNSSH